jgi:hypothetical protein
MKMKSKLLLSAAFALVASTAFASSENVSVSFRVIGPGMKPGMFQFASNGNPAKVALAPDTRSPVQVYKGPADIVFRELSPVGKEFAAKLPDTKDLLLLVFSAPADGEPKILVFRDDLDSFPMGSTFFLNSGTVPLGLRFGAQAFDIAPGESSLVPPGSSKTSFVQILRDGSSGKDVVFSNNWAASPGQRTIVFLSNDSSEPPNISVSRISEGSPPAIK